MNALVNLPVMAAALGAISLTPGAVLAQRFPTHDPTLRAIWTEGMDRSRLRDLAVVLMDSIGPRLTGSPADIAGHDWLVATYAGWGIRAFNEQYAAGARRWRRGPTHVDLVSPRVRTLQATMSAWSPGTSGPVEGTAMLVPTLADSAAFQAWLPSVRGRWILLSADPPSCRSDEEWRREADSAAFAAFRAERARNYDRWLTSLRNSGLSTQEIPARLEQAGALGFIVFDWYGRYGWDLMRTARSMVFGTMRSDGTTTTRAPMVDMSCEDYGLVSRLARHGFSPRLRVNAESEMLGPAPVLNTIAEIRGTERPDEYVVLSAHFDSWDGASGATDNGTGTLVMMEAMRILKAVYPRPKRTIVVRHWSGEEQGIGTSRAFRADMTAVAGKTQAVFNQDTGTGRVTRVSISGLPAGAEAWARWAARLPLELSHGLAVGAPGTSASTPMRDLCQGFPVYQLFSNGDNNANNSAQSWSYGTTHHSSFDTLDKVIFDEVTKNAVLTAMMAYMAADDPQLTPDAIAAEAQVHPKTGAPTAWPACPLPAPFK